MNETENKTEQTTKINDKVRKALIRDRLMITIGVQGLSTDTQTKIMQAIAEFDDFKESNDPHKEHDFGAVEVDGHKVFFKLDYYDNALEYGSPYLYDRAVTRRVMTVMLAKEH